MASLSVWAAPTLAGPATPAAPAIEAAPLGVAHAIQLDGHLTEDVWKRAPAVTGFLQREPQEGSPATFETEFRVAYISNLRIGTRGSPLALAQAGWVRDRLLSLGEKRRPEIVPIKTSGDQHADLPLASMGGKGAFIRELVNALLAGEIDLAVHSMKDLPVDLPPGLLLAAITARENPLDVFISRTGTDLDGLPAGTAVGTGSLRRKAQLLR